MIARRSIADSLSRAGSGRDVQCLCPDMMDCIEAVFAPSSRYRYGRWSALAATYSAYAFRVLFSSETSLTGTSHQALPGGLGPVRSVSMYRTVVRSLAAAFA